MYGIHTAATAQWPRELMRRAPSGVPGHIVYRHNSSACPSIGTFEPVPPATPLPSRSSESAAAWWRRYSKSAVISATAAVSVNTFRRRRWQGRGD